MTMPSLRLLAALGVLLVAAPAFAQARIAFATERHDFARLDEGDVVTTTFAFTNTGDAPLRLADVRPSCGCTTPEYPTGAIAPGATGEIVVAYHSEGRPGPFEKHVTVVTDGPAATTTTLTIVGDVVPGFTRGGVAQGSVVFEHDTYVEEAAQRAPSSTPSGSRTRARRRSGSGRSARRPARPSTSSSRTAPSSRATSPAWS